MATINSSLNLKPQDFYFIYNTLRSVFTTNDFVRAVHEIHKIEVTAKQANDYLSRLGFVPFGDKRDQYNKAAILERNSERCFLRRKSKFAKPS